MTVRKAIIPAAGFGTRMLPVTNAFAKELLPIGNIPVFHFILCEIAQAGLETVIVVNAPSKPELDNYLNIDAALTKKLYGTPQESLLTSLEQLKQRIDLVSIRQYEGLGLGHAVATAAPIVGDEAFAVLLPDEIILQTPNVLTSLLAVATKQEGAVAVQQVLPTDVHRYGMIAPATAQLPCPIIDLVEKPAIDQAPSNWAIVGRYVFPAKFQQALRQLDRGQGGELQLTDAMRKHLPNFPLQAVPIVGERFDTGHLAGYENAWRAFLSNPKPFIAASHIP